MRLFHPHSAPLETGPANAHKTAQACRVYRSRMIKVELLKSLLIHGEQKHAGEIVEIEHRDARELIGRGVAVNVIAKHEPEPEQPVQEETAPKKKK